MGVSSRLRRLLVPALVSISLVSMVPTSTSKADEGRAKRKLEHELLLRVLAAIGEKQAGADAETAALEPIRRLKFSEPRRVAKKERLVKELMRETNPQDYVTRLLPLYEGRFTEDELRLLVESLEKPVFQKLLKVRMELARPTKEVQTAWRSHLRKQWFERFAGSK